MANFLFRTHLFCLIQSRCDHENTIFDTNCYFIAANPLLHLMAFQFKKFLSNETIWEDEFLGVQGDARKAPNNKLKDRLKLIVYNPYERTDDGFQAWNKQILIDSGAVNSKALSSLSRLYTFSLPGERMNSRQLS